MSDIVIAAAHPDDEALGCGGTIARHAAAGARVHVLVFTNGVGARAGTSDADSRRAAFEAATRHLGVSTARMLDFPDNELDSVPLLTVARRLEGYLVDIKP